MHQRIGYDIRNLWEERRRQFLGQTLATVVDLDFVEAL